MDRQSTPAQPNDADINRGSPMFYAILLGLIVSAFQTERTPPDSLTSSFLVHVTLSFTYFTHVMFNLSF